jgi:hypothetical protein
MAVAMASWGLGKYFCDHTCVLKASDRVASGSFIRGSIGFSTKRFFILHKTG